MDTDKRLKEIRMRTVENKLLFEDSNALAYDVVDKTFDYGVFALENVPFLLDEIERLNNALDKALKIAVEYGGVDGAHHKDWVIDQMVRSITGDKYEQVIADACAGEDGPDTYSWDIGIAP